MKTRKNECSDFVSFDEYSFTVGLIFVGLLTVEFVCLLILLFLGFSFVLCRLLSTLSQKIFQYHLHLNYIWYQLQRGKLLDLAEKLCKIKLTSEMLEYRNCTLACNKQN